MMTKRGLAEGSPGAWLAAAWLFVASGCGSVPRFPTQSVMVSTAAVAVAQGVDVNVNSFPPNLGIRSGIVEGEGGHFVTEFARPYTPPGISANASFYLLAYWGGQPGFNFLHLFVSERGRVWSRAGSFFAASSSQINGESRPSVTFFPPTNTWFVAFRDASTGEINVMQFSVFCQRSPSGDCQIDLDPGREGATQFTSRFLGNVNTQLTTSRPPTLSFIGNSLVVIFSPVSATVAPLRAATSTDGTAFGAAQTVLQNGSPLFSEGAPFLHHSWTGDVFLATSVGSAIGSVDIHIWRSISADGVTWTRVRDVNSVGAPIILIDPAIAGSEAALAIAYPSVTSAVGTMVTGIGTSGTILLPTQTNRGVGLTFGPGPTFTGRQTCAEPNLVARGGSGDVAIGAGRETLVDADNRDDVTLLCGASAQSRAGCPSGTRTVIIDRSTGPSFTVACWPSSG